MSFDRFLGFGSDPCAVLDREGTIVAVNDVWSVRAATAGATATTGTGADYLAVCRRAVTTGAPQADVALAAIRGLVGGGHGRSSFLYPCTEPTGTRWFRADVVGVGATGNVGIRHVDVTLDHRDGGDPGRVVDTDAIVMTAAGLKLAVADALDGPPRPAVVVAVTDLPAGDEPAAALAIGAVAADLDRPVHTVARLDDRTLGLLITAPDTAAAMATADTIIRTVARRTGGEMRRWSLANAVPGDDADSVLARARRSLVRHLGATSDRDIDVDADRSARLQRAASALTAAVAEFERALDRGLDMTTLRVLDHEVERAEQACAAAAGSRGLVRT